MHLSYNIDGPLILTYLICTVLWYTTFQCYIHIIRNFNILQGDGATKEAVNDCLKAWNLTTQGAKLRKLPPLQKDGFSLPLPPFYHLMLLTIVVVCMAMLIVAQETVLKNLSTDFYCVFILTAIIIEAFVTAFLDDTRGTKYFIILMLKEYFSCISDTN